MANYQGNTLSNNVKVKDVNKFKEIINNLPSDAPIVIEADEVKSEFMFHCNGIINLEEENTEAIHDIQKLLCDDEVLVIKEIGREKFKYLYSDAYLISPKYWTRLDLDHIIENSIKEMKELTKSDTHLKIVSIDTGK